MTNELWAIAAFIMTFVMLVIMYRFFGKEGLFVWVAVGTVIANIQVTKSVELFGITATLGNVLFASIYLATDILNDRYGRQVAKKACMVRFFIRNNNDRFNDDIFTIPSSCKRYCTAKS